MSYLICYYSESWNLQGPGDQRQLSAVQREAERQGIGWIIARQEDDFGVWDERVSPHRFERDPPDLDKFLREQMPEHLDALRAWLRDG